MVLYVKNVANILTTPNLDTQGSVQAAKQRTTKMSKNRMYCQCVLRKGDNIQVSWIPEKFAEVGRVLRLKEDNGWVVQRVDSKMPENMMVYMRDEYRHHRKVTDI